MEREGLVARAAEQGKRLLDRLRSALAGHPHVAEVRGLGLLLGVELVRDRATLEPFPECGQVHQPRGRGGLRRGRVLLSRRRRRRARLICLGPPFTIGDEEIELIATALPKAIDAAAAGVARLVAGIRSRVDPRPPDEHGLERQSHPGPDAGSADVVHAAWRFAGKTATSSAMMPHAVQRRSRGTRTPSASIASPSANSATPDSSTSSRCAGRYGGMICT